MSRTAIPMKCERRSRRRQTLGSPRLDALVTWFVAKRQPRRACDGLGGVGPFRGLEAQRASPRAITLHMRYGRESVKEPRPKACRTPRCRFAKSASLSFG